MYRTPAEIPRARLPMLDQVTIKTPCRESWDAMDGDDRVRFCARCSKNVYDLTAMTQDEAETFLATHLDEEDRCVRLYRRPDGRVLTSECVQGARTRHGRKVAAGIVAGLCAVAASTVALANVHVPSSARKLPHSHARIDVKRLAGTAVPSGVSDANPFPAIHDRNEELAAASGWSMGAMIAEPPADAARIETPSRFPPSPVIKQSRVVVERGLPIEVVSRIVRQNYGRLRLCYENTLAKKPDLAGEVGIRFHIGRDGAVIAAQDDGSTLADPGTVACIVRGFQNLSFPQPDGGVISVSYRLSMRPHP